MTLVTVVTRSSLIHYLIKLDSRGNNTSLTNRILDVVRVCILEYIARCVSVRFLIRSVGGGGEYIKMNSNWVGAG